MSTNTETATHRTIHTATGTKVHASVRLSDGWYDRTMCGTAITYRLTVGTEGTLAEVAEKVTCQGCADRLAIVAARNARS